MMYDIMVALLLAAAIGGLCAYSYYLWELRREIHILQGPKLQFRTAAHEAGHAIAVLEAERAMATLHSVTTVPDNDSMGKVFFNVIGMPIYVQWEHVIILLGGAAGEYVAKGDVDVVCCGRDFSEALSYASRVERMFGVAMELSGGPIPTLASNTEFDLRHFYNRELSPSTLAVLNFCFAEAVQRILRKEPEFFKLTSTLLTRRELTGQQVYEVLSQRSN